MSGAVRFDLEREKGELIGFASSKDGVRPRWTTLSVWYLHAPEHAQRGRRWVSEVRAETVVPGEVPRIIQLRVGSLDRALKIFDETDLGIAAIETARDWWEAQQAIPPAALVDFESDANALEWLYGGKTDGGKATYASMFARDFGVPVRTVQVALERGTGIRVPLRAVLRHFNREAFLASRKGDS